MKGRFAYAMVLSAGFIMPAAVQAQQPAQSGVPAQSQAQGAAQCLSDLEEFRVRALQDGYWLAGWGTRWAYGAATAPGGTGEPVGTAPGVAGEPTARPGVPPGAWGVAGPWGATGMPAAGMMSPRHQMQTLYAAAMVFAWRGNERACQGVLAELTEMYDETVEALAEAGVSPEEVVTWRQEQIVAAQDVTEVPWTMSSDQIIGTDIRNAQDQHLGTIDDLIVDHRTGEVTHAVVSHGGFLGIGEDHVAIPWNMLKVTPGMTLFVLDVPESVVENAPRVDPEQLASPGVYEQYRQAVDLYWEQHAPA